MSNNQKPQIEKAAEMTPFMNAYLISKEIFYGQATNSKAEANIQAGAEKILSFAKEYALSLSKPEKEAYKKQISELQSKLMTERRSNAKIAKRAEKKKEWIPVSERLPEPGSEILVYRDLDEPRIESDTANDDFFRFYDWNNITHWMPAPSPPNPK